jgi:hypothetical protein
VGCVGPCVAKKTFARLLEDFGGKQATNRAGIANQMIEDFERFPLPPPWRSNPVEMTYINDDTGEVSTIHPYQRLLDKRAAAGQSPVQTKMHSGDMHARFQDDLGWMREDGADGPLFIGESNSVVPLGSGPGTMLPIVETREKKAAAAAASSSLLGAPLSDKNLKQKMKGMKCQDFRCMWKELNLMGETNAYGLIIRYYPDGQTVIKFDGVEGMWHLSQLTGPYGPLDRYDLFVGSKVTVFGRHMSIASCSASACRWIEDEAVRLSKQQEWLQQRVESVGAVPVVQRAPPEGPLQHQGRSSKPAGSDNLRMKAVNNAKLAEQLANLGMAGCVAPSFYTKSHQKDSF